MRSKCKFIPFGIVCVNFSAVPVIQILRMDRLIRQSRQRRQVYLDTLDQIRVMEDRLESLRNRGFDRGMRGMSMTTQVLQAQLQTYRDHARRLREEAQLFYRMAHAARYMNLYRRLPRDMQYEVDRRR